MSIRTPVLGGVAIFVPAGFVKVNKGLILGDDKARGIGAAMSGTSSGQHNWWQRSWFNGVAASRTAFGGGAWTGPGSGVSCL